MAAVKMLFFRIVRNYFLSVIYDDAKGSKGGEDGKSIDENMEAEPRSTEDDFHIAREEDGKRNEEKPGNVHENGMRSSVVFDGIGHGGSRARKEVNSGGASLAVLHKLIVSDLAVTLDWGTSNIRKGPQQVQRSSSNNIIVSSTR